MPKTSDFCPRCQSVQVGLRRGDGQFVCLRCSSKQEVAEAASAPVRVSAHEDLRSSRSLGLAALSLGLLTALAAVPVTLYCRAAGDSSTAFLIVLPTALIPLFLGLVASRNRMGQGGAVLSLFACIVVLFMVLILESSRNQRGSKSLAVHDRSGGDRRSVSTAESNGRKAPPTQPVRQPAAAPDAGPVVPDSVKPDPANDEAVDSLAELRARAQMERQRLDGIRQLQELVNVYYAAAQQAEQLSGQRELLEVQRVRVKAQIASCELRIRKAKVDEDARKAKRPDAGAQVNVIIYNAQTGPPVLYTEAERITFERKDYENQLANLDNQVLFLTQQIGAAQAKATMAVKTIRDHCALIGEPAPELRTFMELPAEPAKEPGPVAVEEREPEPRVLQVYRLKDGREIRAAEIERKGDELVLQDEEGRTYTLLVSDVQEVIVQSVMPGEGKEPEKADAPAVNAPAVDGSSPKQPVAEAQAPEPKVQPKPENKFKTYVMRDGRMIKAQHVIEMGEELAIRDPEGEVHQVKRADVREILR